MSNDAKLSELERLKKLKDDGVLSDEEYEKMKHDILYGAEKKIEDTPKEIPSEKIIEAIQESQAEVPLPEIVKEVPIQPSVSPQQIHSQIIQPPSEQPDVEQPQITPSEPSISSSSWDGVQTGGKKLSPTLLGFIAAVVVVVLVFILLLVFSGGKDKKDDTDSSLQDTSSEVVMDVIEPSDTTFMESLAGVWSDNNELVSIVYEVGSFHLWVGDILVSSRIGEIDLPHDSVNIKSDKDEIAGTLKKQWNTDKSSFVLAFTDSFGQQYNLNFVRKVSADDLKRLTRLQKEAEEEKKKLEKEAKQRFAEEVYEFASGYAQSAMDADSADALSGFYAQRVKYFDRGELALADVIKDKKNYYRKWSKRQNRILSDIKITDGKNGEKIASYTYEFVVSNAEKEIRGTAVQYITIVQKNDELYVVGESSKNIKTQEKDLTKLNSEDLEFKPDNGSGGHTIQDGNVRITIKEK